MHLPINASTSGKNCRLQRVGTQIVRDATEQRENTERNQWIFSRAVTKCFGLGDSGAGFGERGTSADEGRGAVALATGPPPCAWPCFMV